MSFDVGPLRPQPLIQGSQRMQNDGGGGNLGYMQQGGKKKDEDEKKQDEFFASKDDSADVIQLSIEDESSENSDNFSATKWFGDIAEKIANKLVHKSNNPFKNA